MLQSYIFLHIYIYKIKGKIILIKGRNPQDKRNTGYNNLVTISSSHMT